MSQNNFRTAIRSLKIDAPGGAPEVEQLYADLLGEERSLRIDAISDFFKKRKREARATVRQMAIGDALATSLRSVKPLYAAAISATEALEAEERQLVALRHNLPVDVRFGLTIKSRNLMAPRDLMRTWGDDNSGDIDGDEFDKHVKGLGFQSTAAELAELYALFDDDDSGTITLDEVRGALKKLANSVAQFSATESAKAKKVAVARAAAEEAQYQCEKALVAAEKGAEAAAPSERSDAPSTRRM